jgi:alkane 1-monooxygenase
MTYMKDWRFIVPIYSYVILETFAWLWALIIFSDEVTWFDNMRPSNNFDLFIFTLNMGKFVGINAIAGHELFHKKEWYYKMLGGFAYTKFLYSHLPSEHVYGHHKNVATPEDPATAIFGETVHQFILRNVWGSLKS